MGCDIHGVFQKRAGDAWVDVPSRYEQDRHYMLFAWLGNVRNGFGFAGMATHTEIPPLSDCRGFPDGFVIDGDDHQIESIDVMDPRRREWREEGDPLSIWMGDHSHSWVSADEVLSTTPPSVLRTGIVSIKQFAEWDGKSSPQSWCGGISGPDVVVSDPSSIEANTTHVRIEWFENADETLKYFIDEVRRLKDEHGDVRFVFGFDS